MIRVVLADDHEIVRNGIKLVLNGETDIEVVGEAADGQEAVDLVARLKPDILIADIRMPIMTGIEVTSRVKKNNPELKVLVLTMHDDSEYILKSLKEGADGYLLKDTNRNEFIKAVHLVFEGQKYFSGDISSTIVNSYLSASHPASEPEAVGAGVDQYQLTKREREILQLIYDGVSNKEIADRLNKSIRTIETHRFNIMKKLEVNNITELLKKIDREGVLG